MTTITKFEDLAIWQLAWVQTNDFDVLVETTPLGKTYELRANNILMGNKLMSFITYLQNSSFKGQRYKSKE